MITSPPKIEYENTMRSLKTSNQTSAKRNIFEAVLLIEFRHRLWCSVKVLRRKSLTFTNNTKVSGYPFYSQEWSISNFPCSLTRNITSHSMKNLAFHSLLRWKIIILSISYYITYISKTIGRMYFLSLGVKRLNLEWRLTWYAADWHGKVTRPSCQTLPWLPIFSHMRVLTKPFPSRWILSEPHVSPYIWYLKRMHWTPSRSPLTSVAMSPIFLGSDDSVYMYWPVTWLKQVLRV